MICVTLRADVVQALEKTFELTTFPAHGHFQAVRMAMQRLGIGILPGLQALSCARPGGLRGGRTHRLSGHQPGNNVPETHQQFHSQITRNSSVGRARVGRWRRGWVQGIRQCPIASSNWLSALTGCKRDTSWRDGRPFRGFYDTRSGFVGKSTNPQK